MLILEPRKRRARIGSGSTRRIARLGILVGLVPLASTAAPPLRSVSLSQAIALAQKHNPDVRASHEDVVSAKGALRQSKALPNPGLFISSLGTQVAPLDAPVPNQLGLTWTVPIGGKLGAGIAAAKASVDAAHAGNLQAQRQLSFDVAQAFVAVLLAKSELEFAKADRDDFHQALGLEELRYKDGKIAFGDVLKLRIQAVSEDDAVRQARQNLVSARADLIQLLGEGVLADDFTAQGSLSTPPPVPSSIQPLDAKTLFARALANRKDYLALGAQMKSAQALVTQAKRGPIPDLDLLADYNHASGAKDSFDLQIGVALPIFDQNTGNVTQAEAAYAKATLAKESLRNQLANAARKAVAEWKSSTAQLQAYQAHLVDEAKQSLAISKRAYRLGEGSLLDFLDAETRYRQVESAYRIALARVATAAYTLRFIAGASLP